MKIDKKVRDLRVALAMVGVVSTNQGCEAILMVQEKLAKLDNKFSLMDAVKIQNFITEKYHPKKKEEPPKEPDWSKADGWASAPETWPKKKVRKKKSKKKNAKKK